MFSDLVGSTALSARMVPPPPFDPRFSADWAAEQERQRLSNGASSYRRACSSPPRATQPVEILDHRRPAQARGAIPPRLSRGGS
jgi:hypothetical protein